MPRQFQKQLLHAAKDDGLAAEMSRFYDDLDAAIAARRPTCWNKGACCKFGSYGHRLFVTSVELFYFIRGLAEDWRPPTDEDECPYQVDGLCTAREHRPMGCRIFFCDPAAQSWQNGEYERQLARLKAIGSAAGVAYRYMEWLSALKTASEALSCGEIDGFSHRHDPANQVSIDPSTPRVIELQQVRRADSHR